MYILMDLQYLSLWLSQFATSGIWYLEPPIRPVSVVLDEAFNEARACCAELLGGRMELHAAPLEGEIEFLRDGDRDFGRLS